MFASLGAPRHHKMQTQPAGRASPPSQAPAPSRGSPPGGPSERRSSPLTLSAMLRGSCKSGLGVSSTLSSSLLEATASGCGMSCRDLGPDEGSALGVPAPPSPTTDMVEAEQGRAEASPSRRRRRLEAAWAQPEPRPLGKPPPLFAPIGRRKTAKGTPAELRRPRLRLCSCNAVAACLPQARGLPLPSLAERSRGRYNVAVAAAAAAPRAISPGETPPSAESGRP